MCCDYHNRKALTHRALLSVWLTPGQVWPPFYLCLQQHYSQHSPHLICSFKMIPWSIFKQHTFHKLFWQIESKSWSSRLISNTSFPKLIIITVCPFCPVHIQTLISFPTILALEKGMTLFLGPRHCPWSPGEWQRLEGTVPPTPLQTPPPTA